MITVDMTNSVIIDDLPLVADSYIDYRTFSSPYELEQFYFDQIQRANKVLRQLKEIKKAS